MKEFHGEFEILREKSLKSKRESLMGLFSGRIVVFFMQSSIDFSEK